MNDNDTHYTAMNLAEMLPAGMLLNGGTVAEAMAAVASRKRGQPGWEAFHYERISGTEFELTGALLVMSGASKRWPEPHDSVLVSEAEILQELQGLQQLAGVILPSEPAATPAIGTQADGASYLNVQFALPPDPAGRLRVLQAFHLHADFFGATVLACALSDKKT